MYGEKELIRFVISKLKELKIKTEFEDRKNKKIRYISKRSAYQDLINLLERMSKYE